LIFTKREVVGPTGVSPHFTDAEGALLERALLPQDKRAHFSRWINGDHGQTRLHAASNHRALHTEAMEDHMHPVGLVPALCSLFLSMDLHQPFALSSFP
jgi:hypothetical protein